MKCHMKFRPNPFRPNPTQSTDEPDQCHICGTDRGRAATVENHGCLRPCAEISSDKVYVISDWHLRDLSVCLFIAGCLFVLRAPHNATSNRRRVLLTLPAIFPSPRITDGAGCTPRLQKKQDTKLLPITSPKVNRFSKFFHWQIHWLICNKLMFKYSTTP